MDFHGMKRKQLQALCKKHGIPANKSNLEMANLLTSALKAKEISVSQNQGEIDNENDCGDVPERVRKKVRFSPDVETCEYEPTAYKKRGRRRRTVVNPAPKKLVQADVDVVVSPVVWMKRGKGGRKTVSVNDKPPPVVGIDEDSDVVKDGDKENKGLVRRRCRNREVVIEENGELCRGDLVDFRKNSTSIGPRKRRNGGGGDRILLLDELSEENVNAGEDGKPKNARRRSKRIAQKDDSSVLLSEESGKTGNVGRRITRTWSKVEGRTSSIEDKTEIVKLSNESKMVLQLKETKNGLSRNASRQKSNEPQNVIASGIVATKVVKLGKHVTQSKINVAKCTDSAPLSMAESRKVEVVRRITRSGAQFSGNASAAESIVEVVGDKDECKGAVQVGKLLRGQARNASRQKSVAPQRDKVESDGSEVKKAMRKRSRNSDFEAVTDIEGCIDPSNGIEKASLTNGHPRRSRRKTVMLNSTVTSDELRTGEPAGGIRQSRERISGKDVKTADESPRLNRHASRCSLVATSIEVDDIANGVGKVGQQKRQCEPVPEKKILAVVGESLIGKPPRRSIQHVPEGELIEPSAPSKIVEKDLQSMARLPIVVEETSFAENISPIKEPPNEDLRLTMPEAMNCCKEVLKSSIKEKGSKSKSGVKRTCLLDVSAGCSDIKQDIDTTMKLEETLAPISLNLVGASTNLETPETVLEPQVINKEADIVVDDGQKLVTEGNVENVMDDQSCQSLKSSADLNNNLAEPERAESQAKACDVVSAADGFSSANRLHFAGLEKGLQRELSAGKYLFLERVDVHSTEIEGISAPKDGACGFEGTEQDIMMDKNEHEEVLHNALPAVHAEMAREATEGSFPEDSNVLHQFVKTVARLTGEENIVPVRNFYKASDVSREKYVHQHLDEGKSLIASDEKDIDRGENYPAATVALKSPGTVHTLPTENEHQQVSCIGSERLSYCMDSLAVDSKTQHQEENRLEGLLDKEGISPIALEEKDIYNSENYSAATVALKLSGIGYERLSYCASILSMDSNIQHQEDKQFEGQLTSSVTDSHAIESTDAVSCGPEDLFLYTCDVIDAAGEKIGTSSNCKAQKGVLEGIQADALTQPFLEELQDEKDATEVHNGNLCDDICRSSEAAGKESCMLKNKLDMQEARQGGTSHPNSPVGPGKALSDHEDEFSKLDDAGLGALSKVVSADCEDLDGALSGVTEKQLGYQVKAEKLDDLKEQNISEPDKSAFLASEDLMSMDVKGQDGKENVGERECNLKLKYATTDTGKEYDVFTTQVTSPGNLDHVVEEESIDENGKNHNVVLHDACGKIRVAEEDEAGATAIGGNISFGNIEDYTKGAEKAPISVQMFGSSGKQAKKTSSEGKLFADVPFGKTELGSCSDSVPELNVPPCHGDKFNSDLCSKYSSKEADGKIISEDRGSSSPYTKSLELKKGLECLHEINASNEGNCTTFQEVAKKQLDDYKGKVKEAAYFNEVDFVTSNMPLSGSVHSSSAEGANETASFYKLDSMVASRDDTRELANFEKLYIVSSSMPRKCVDYTPLSPVFAYENMPSEIHLGSAFFTNWEVNMIQGNEGEHQVEKFDEVTFEDNLTSEDSRHTVRAKDNSMICKKIHGQIAGNQLREALITVSDFAITDESMCDGDEVSNRLDNSSAVSCEFIDHKNQKDEVATIENSNICKHGVMLIAECASGDLNDVENISHLHVQGMFENEVGATHKEACTATTGKMDMSAEVGTGGTLPHVMSNEASHEMGGTMQPKSICGEQEGSTSGSSTAEGQQVPASSEEFELQQHCEDVINDACSKETTCNDTGSNPTGEGQLLQVHDKVTIEANGQDQKAIQSLIDATDGSRHRNSWRDDVEGTTKEEPDEHQDVVNEAASICSVNCLPLKQPSFENKSESHAIEAEGVTSSHKIDDKILTGSHLKEVADLSLLEHEIVDCSTVSTTGTSSYLKNAALELNLVFEDGQLDAVQKSDATNLISEDAGEVQENAMIIEQATIQVAEGPHENQMEEEVAELKYTNIAMSVEPDFESVEGSKKQDSMPAKVDNFQNKDESVKVDHCHVSSQKMILMEAAEANAFHDGTSLNHSAECDPRNLEKDNFSNISALDVREAMELSEDVSKLEASLVDQFPAFANSFVGQGIASDDDRRCQLKLLSPQRTSLLAKIEESHMLYPKQLNSSATKTKTNKIGFIQGTPQKVLDLHDMKENVPSIKREQIYNMTAPKTLSKRRALEDLRQN